MNNSDTGGVLACPRVEELPIPPMPSFICQCAQCGARIWVAHSSLIEPMRLCVSCSVASHAEHNNDAA
jgi:hypothetical protein